MPPTPDFILPLPLSNHLFSLMHAQSLKVDSHSPLLIFHPRPPFPPFFSIGIDNRQSIPSLVRFSFFLLCEFFRLQERYPNHFPLPSSESALVIVCRRLFIIIYYQVLFLEIPFIPSLLYELRSLLSPFCGGSRVSLGPMRNLLRLPPLSPLSLPSVHSFES